MESSQNFGGAEECHSSESGWTMYIGSPIDGDDDDVEHEGDQDDNGDDDDDDDSLEVDHHQDDSDDSMVSDASSGPSHLGNQWRNGEGGHRLADHLNHVVDKYNLDKKGNKPREKQRADRRVEKEERMFIRNKAKAPLQSGDNKVRKNLWMGKGK
ncbi:acidic leucine-rich nuclear phosphoprotein 32 family member B-like [Quillaja saponaria]|uniref:Acidic leucine-rich nuclear phosphoprotein 32 family member B-like n=1 Tax=Quillaja saponaria TaxID=32244 RepID=A0AAD7PI63_QUISA|nr:acidic leucine-rich nuclear phosphoprotein 32 family member B-like [Quillaja saponaria]